MARKASSEAQREPTNDLSPLGNEDRPYHYRIGESVAQFNMPQTALWLSRQVGMLVGIYDARGKLVRTVDGRIAAEDKGERPPRAPRPPKGETKQEKALALLMRDQGATQAELSKLVGWSMGQWHVNRLARTRKMEIVRMGEKHWRLVKRET